MKKLLESIAALEGPMGMPPSLPAPEMDKGNPVTVNVNMNASGKEHVADLLDMMKNAGLNDAEPVSAKTLSPRLDMERLAGIMDDPKIPGKDEVPGDEDTTDSSCNDDIDADDEPVEEFANSPEGSEGDPDYKDHHYMTKDLSGGINRKKKQYKAAQPGDNAMAMEDIKEHLYNLLAEKKKPDADGDGVPDWADKKPGKDDNEGKKKGSKPKKGEVPPQFQKEAIEDKKEKCPECGKAGKVKLMACASCGCK